MAKRSNQVIPITEGGQQDERHRGELTGPVVDGRRFTDCLFFILFVAFWAGMFIIAGFAGKNGNVKNLLYGQDSNGDVCGTGSLTNDKYLYWPQITVNYAVCVNHCPGSESSDRVMSAVEMAAANTLNATCGNPSIICPDIPSADLLVIPGTTTQCCPYKSKSLFYRCYPDYANITVQSVLDYASNSINSPHLNGQRYVGDIYRTWQYQILFAACAFVFSFVFLFLVAMFGHLLIWLIIFLLIGVMAGTTAYLWSYANTSQHQAPKGAPHLNARVQNAETARILAYIMIAVTVFTIVLVIVLRKRIRLAVAMFREAGRCLRNVPSTLLIPILMFCGYILLVIYWIYILLLLASAYRTASHTVATVSNTSNASNAVFIDQNGVHLTDNKQTIQYLAIYHFFGLLWTTNFLIAVGQIAIAGVTATWYFTRDKSTVPFRVSLDNLFRAGFYHPGTAAFGALIVAIVQFIRYWHEYLRQQQEKSGQSNQATRCVFCCIECCLACVERFLKFVSKNAFVMTAIYGDSFCRGAYRSFKLILRNILRVATVNWVSDFLVFLIKLLVVFSVALIALGVFQNLNGNTVGSSDLTNIQFWIVPLILACIIAYFIASLFCTVLEMIIDAILICFLEDEERSASGEHQPYMSGDLRRYMGVDASIGGAELQGK